MSVCKTAECGNTLKTHSKLETCQTCRGTMGFWTNKKSPADIMQRRRKLNKYQWRMANVVKGKKGRVW